MEYPTEKEVDKANHLQVCEWYRFLKTPENDSQKNILKFICERYKSFGGMTPKISKQIGWK